jgi:hypothetical protein
MLRECQTLLISVTLQVDSLDRRQWRSDPVSGYSVRDAYELLTSQEEVTLGDAEDLLWHKQVPLKVSIFACRLLRDRLPTMTNLVTWGILSPDLDTCVTGCATLSLRNTCSFLLAPLVHFGHSFGLGLAFRRRMHIVSQIILFSSLIQRAGPLPGGLCYRLFGSLVFGLCGTRETSESSKIQRTQFFCYWTKSSCFHIGG